MLIATTFQAVHRILFELQSDDETMGESVPLHKILERCKKYEVGKSQDENITSALKELELLNLAKHQGDEWTLTGAGEVLAINLMWPSWCIAKYSSAENPRIH